MKLSIVTILFIMPLTVWAGPFDGTWKTDMSTAKVEGKPSVYLLKDGTYTCSTCVPEVKIAADGKPHEVTGHSYYDQLTVTVASPQSVKVNGTLAGKRSIDRTLTVAADGSMLTDEVTDYTGSKPATAKFAAKRVGAVPAGAHAISGSWQPDVKDTTISSDLTTVTYQQTDDGLKMSSPTGQSYDARFDGKEYLTAGDPGKTMVSLKKLGPNKIEETDRRLGKVTDVFLMDVSTDGKKMHVIDHDKQSGQTVSWTADKD
jgi:hypothetical protein